MGRPIVLSSTSSPRLSLSGNAGDSRIDSSPAIDERNKAESNRTQTPEVDAEQLLRDSRRSTRDEASGHGEHPSTQQRQPPEGQLSKPQQSSHAVLLAAGALVSDAPASAAVAANHSNGRGQGSSSSSSSDVPPDLSEAEVLARVAFLKEVFVQWDKGWDEQALRNLARVMRAKTFGAYETVVRQDGHAETVRSMPSRACSSSARGCPPAAGHQPPAAARTSESTHVTFRLLVTPFAPLQCTRFVCLRALLFVVPHACVCVAPPSACAAPLHP